MIDDDLANYLLGSIETNRLVAIVGAGLSMAAPSLTPSAAELLDVCKGKYHEITGKNLSPEITTNLESFTDHFIESGDFQGLLINNLVPWNRFRGIPNDGHFAIADFLGCKVLESVLSTNFDYLIEKAAESIGEDDFQPTVYAEELNRYTNHSPLLKLHGCCVRKRVETIWSTKQLEDPNFFDRTNSLSKWFGNQLRGRDLLVIGFWTDWDYLCEILIAHVSLLEPRMVVIVNPTSLDELAVKAPKLWEWASGEDVNLSHVPSSATEFLDELRRRFSKQFIYRLIGNSVDLFESITGNQPSHPLDLDELDTIDLYSKRRDFCGQNSSEIVRKKRPEEYQNSIGAIHLLILEQGGEITGSLYRFNDQVVRIINGNGKLISQLRKRYSKEPLDLIEVDIVICVGAHFDGGSRESIIRELASRDFIRGTTSGEWITDKTFLSRIGFEQDENN